MLRFAWRRAAALCAFGVTAVGCAGDPSPEEHAAAFREAFTSAGAVLVTFDFDATLTTDTTDPDALDRLVAAQLLFTVGQLNGESSVGRLDRAAYRIRTVTQLPDVPSGFELGYHARFPVAWGGGAVPSSYTLTLPQTVTQEAQEAFAQKYGGACTDPEGGTVDAGDLFLFYRPRQPGCALDATDVTTTDATVSAGDVPARETYPEYHRIWEDGELDYVALFGREADPPADGDEGMHAYDDFVARARDYVARMQRDPTMRAESADGAASDPNVTLTATLDDGRRVRIDVVSVGPSLRADAGFGPWYAARTSNADAIVYSGHAGLGDNVRALMGLGVFRPKKYVVTVMNGCDTFAYVDDTLVARRAALNPDDPSGTRWMDTVTNVLGGYFHSEAATSMLLLDAFVSSAEGAPKKYREIFSAVDPTQIMLVSGDEDNEFQPGMLPGAPAPTLQTSTPPSSATPPPSVPASGARGHACAAAPTPAGNAVGALACASLVVALVARRRGARGYFVAVPTDSRDTRRLLPSTALLRSG